MSSSEVTCSPISPSQELQSGQRHEDEVYGQAERLESSTEKSPNGISNLQTYDAFTPQPPKQSMPTRSNPSTDQYFSREREYVSSSPGEDTDPTAIPSLPSRPNKYQGPPSTWRNWTAAERELAASLDQLVAKDLSVHLYNAFHLKSKARKLREQRIQHVERDEEGSGLELAWVAPKAWTAWPLPPDLVPREGEGVRWAEEEDRDAENYVRPERQQAQVLQDLLQGEVLKKAKERLCRRELDDYRLRSRESLAKSNSGSVSDRSAGTSESAKRSSQVIDARGHLSDQTSTSGHIPKDASSELQSRQGRPRSKRLFSHPGDPDSSESSSDKEPVVMADDDKARDILQPTLRHLLTKLDDLLIGLHQARNAYSGRADSAGESPRDTDEPLRSSRGRRKRISRLRTKNLSCNTDVLSSSTLETKMDPALINNSPPHRQKRRKASPEQRAQSSRKRRGRLGLRDWSDVLGVASMTGWESVIIEKAAARCALLFGEGMKFRTLEEGKAESKESAFLPSVIKLAGNGLDREVSQGNRVSDRTSTNTGSSDEEMVGGVHVDGFLRPIHADSNWARIHRLRQQRHRPRQPS